MGQKSGHLTQANRQTARNPSVHPSERGAQHHTPLGNCKLNRCAITYPLEQLTWKNLQHQVLVERWDSRNPHSLLVEMQKGPPLWKIACQSLPKVNQTKTKQTKKLLPRDPAISLLGSTQSWNLWPHKNLHMEVDSMFTHNCRSLKVIKLSFSRWVDKQAGHCARKH